MPASDRSGPPPTPAEAAALLYLECRLLDERRFEDWLALFTPDGRYRIPGGDSPEPGLEPDIVDDDHDTLEDRVHRLRSPANWAQSPPSRTVHLAGNLEVEPGPAEGEWALHSVLVLYESRNGQTRSFAARCRHILRREGGPAQWRIALKEVRLVDRDTPLFNLTFLL